MCLNDQNDYKEKLIAFLEGMEIQKIPELIEKDHEFIRRVGAEIAGLVKILINRGEV